MLPEVLLCKCHVFSSSSLFFQYICCLLHQILLHHFIEFFIRHVSFTIQPCFYILSSQIPKIGIFICNRVKHYLCYKVRRRCICHHVFKDCSRFLHYLRIWRIWILRFLRNNRNKVCSNNSWFYYGHFYTKWLQLIGHRFAQAFNCKFCANVSRSSRKTKSSSS